MSVHRIQLGNTVFEGENSVYLFEGTGPTTLVDTGIATSDVREKLADGLAGRGLALADIDTVLLTHFHADHAGLAGEIQAESGATVRAHPADAPLIAGDPDAEAAMRREQARCFEAWGMPPEKRAELRSVFEEAEELAGRPAEVEPLEPGESIPVGDETVEVVHLPGHTAGLSGFVRETDAGRELLSGDAVLPVYTPNVGGADVRVERPLERYLSTLTRIADAEFARAWPGHRDAVEDPTARAEEIVEHHRERTERALAVVVEHGPVDAWTVSAHLFGELERIHVLHGPGEAFAHLDHLADAGILERAAEGYVTAPDRPPVESLFPG